MGTLNGFSTFTAPVDNDGSPWGETNYPTQRIYGVGWTPVYTCVAGTTHDAAKDGLMGPRKIPEHDRRLRRHFVCACWHKCVLQA